MIRRQYESDDEEQFRFWSGLALGVAAAIPLWVAILYGALRLARWAGVIQ